LKIGQPDEILPHFPSKRGDAFSLRLKRPSHPHNIGMNLEEDQVAELLHLLRQGRGAHTNTASKRHIQLPEKLYKVRTTRTPMTPASSRVVSTAHLL
jgi:hypothetical protein